MTPPVKGTDTNDGMDNKTRLRLARTDLREARKNELKTKQASVDALAQKTDAEIDAVAQQSTQNNEVFTEVTDADVETIKGNVLGEMAQERNEKEKEAEEARQKEKDEAKQVSFVDEKAVAAVQEGMKEEATADASTSFMPSVVNVKLEDPLHVCGTCGGYSTANGAPSVKNVVVTEEPSKIEEIGEIDEIDEIDEAATSTPRVDAPSLRTDEPNIEEELDWL